MLEGIFAFFSEQIAERKFDTGYIIPDIETNILGDESRIQQILSNLVSSFLSGKTGDPIAIEVQKTQESTLIFDVKGCCDKLEKMECKLSEVK